MADLKDLLLKIANNARLTPLELDELGRFGTETQQNNAFIAGLHNGRASLIVAKINAGKIILGGQSTSGAFLNTFRSSIQNISNNTLTEITGWTILGGDSWNGFSVSGSTIYVPEPGKYRIRLSVLFQAGTTGYRQARIDWNDGSLSDTVDPGSVTATLLNIETNYASLDGNGFICSVKHTDGGTLTISPALYVERIGERGVFAT